MKRKKRRAGKSHAIVPLIVILPPKCIFAKNLWVKIFEERTFFWFVSWRKEYDFKINFAPQGNWKWNSVPPFFLIGELVIFRLGEDGGGRVAVLTWRERFRMSSTFLRWVSQRLLIHTLFYKEQKVVSHTLPCIPCALENQLLFFTQLRQSSKKYCYKRTIWV